MIEIDMGAVMVELPAGTVTLLLADVEGSTRLWERSPDAMGDAVALLDETLIAAVAAHHGVRPLEQGEGDSFVIAFARAADAIACALTLQLTDLGPIALRIGIHTGDVQLRDQNNYIGPTINRTARLRDLGHGGQTLISGTTESLVIDTLPDGATLTDLGTHTLRDLPRPERVVQLGHPELRTDFPPLRIAGSVAAHNVPNQLTTFVGRRRELDELSELLAEHRLITITGVGGAGKTRLAVQVANELAVEYRDGAWFVDLAPIPEPDLVSATVARSLGLPDQPGDVVDALNRFLGQRRMLLVIDNCEHLLDAAASLVDTLLTSCPGLTVLATSRESTGVAGEVSWRVPSLSLGDEAVELFVERARRVCSDFALTDDTSKPITEICRRLDGLPLAIELAAARIRAMSLPELADSLHDRFRVLTGGSRTVMRRQQTLRASVDWSFFLLSDSERTLLQQLSVFTGGFDLDGATAIAGESRYQVLDQLTLMVDKSLLVAENTPRGTRYRMLETIRQYGLEKLWESGDGAAVRSAHRDHFLATASQLSAPTRTDHDVALDRADDDIDNLRAAFRWSLDAGEIDHACTLATSLQPLWLARGRLSEGVGWLDAALSADIGQASKAARVRTEADKILLVGWTGLGRREEHADNMLSAARELGDPSVLIAALIACGSARAYDEEAAHAHFTEAAELARQLSDDWRLTQALAGQATAAMGRGDPASVMAAGDEGQLVAAEIGDLFSSRQIRWSQGWALILAGRLDDAVDMLTGVIDESVTAADMMLQLYSHVLRTFAFAFRGETPTAKESAALSLTMVRDVVEYYEGACYAGLGTACMAAGEAREAWVAYELARQRLPIDPLGVGVFVWAPLAPLACGDCAAAWGWVNAILSNASGCYRAVALVMSARIAFSEGDLDSSRRYAHDALDLVVDYGSFIALPLLLETLGYIAFESGSLALSARVLGSAESQRSNTGHVRFGIHDADHTTLLHRLREALGDDFAPAWAEGLTMTRDEAIAYARQGRSTGKRPVTGWGALTPAERDVVKLVAEGLTNKDVAARLFISPRTVQSHLAHVFTKLGVTTRTQLAQVATALRPTGAG